MPVPALTPPRKYHVAISFAGEDRQYVEEVHKLLKANGLEVFYSNAEQTEMFAEHLPTKLEEIYQRQSHYCLVFVSQSYTNKIWPLKEYRSALKKAVEQKQPYILPARFDDSDLDGLGPEIVFADLRRNMTPAQLASLVLSKLSKSPASPDAPVAAPEPPSTPLIGRGAELSDIQQLLGQEDVRLLVLHGEGGTGKTRLAVEVVKTVEEDFSDGTRAISFKGVNDPASVPSTIARALGVGARETEGLSIEDSLKEFLKNKRMLLLLDDFDQLGDAHSFVKDLIKLPGLKVLITCRSAFEAGGGVRNQEVPPMKRSEAVELFRQSALEVKPGFDLSAHKKIVDKICKSLGDLALAIKVVAARSNWFEPAEILEKLKQYLQGRHGPELNDLQSAMHASVQWNYDLLAPEEQTLFRRLAIFVGGFTPDAASQVCGGSQPGELNGEAAKRVELERFADMGMLRRLAGADGARRFDMADLIREYALCRLRKDGGEADLRRRHAGYFLDLAERADEGIKTPARALHLNRLDEERDNLRAALEWSCSDSGDRELSLRLAGALFWYWNLRAEFSEGRSWLDRALGKPRAARAKALYGAGGMAFLQDDFKTAQPLLEESVAIWRSLGPAHERDLGYALTVLAMTALGLSELDSALESATECVEVFRKQRTDRWGLALALNDLGNVRRRRGEIPEALALYNQSLDLWKDLEDIWGLPLTRSNLGFLLMMDKKFGQARGELEEALEVQRSVSDRWGSAETLKYLGDLAVREEKYQEAEEQYLESLRGNQESGRRQFMIGCLAGLAVSSAGKRRTKLAAFLFGTVSSLREEIEVSERIFDEEMFQQAWRGLDPELRDSPGFQKEHKEGARRKDPAAKLEQAIKKVFQELLLPEAVNSTRSAPRPSPQPEAGAVALKDLLPLKRSGDQGPGGS